MTTAKGSSARRLPGGLQATALMAWLYARTVLRSTKSLAAVSITLVLIALAAFSATRTADARHAQVYVLMVKQLPLGFLVQLAGLLYGTAVVREEIESRTLTYLLVRPIRRWSILLGRWLVAVATVVVLMTAICLLLYFLAAPRAGAGELGLHRVLTTTALGAAYYTTAFTAMGVLFRRPLAVGLGYILFWEMSLPLVPSSAAALSMRFHLLNLAGLAQLDERPAALLPPSVDHTTSIAVLVTATLILAILSLWLFSRREYLPKPQSA